MGGGAAWTDGPTLSVWIYDSPRGAAAGKVRLGRLSQRRAVVVLDAATVTWIRGAHRPRIGRPHSRAPSTSTDPQALDFLLARLTAAAQPGVDQVSALAAELRPAGLGEEFLGALKQSLVPDMSALLVLSVAADFDDVAAVVERGRARGDVRHLHVTLTADELAALGQAARAHASGA